MSLLLKSNIVLYSNSGRWPSAGASARTNPRWTTRNWAEACATTTTRTSSTRQLASAMSTASSVTCRACWERQHRRFWPVWMSRPPTRNRGSVRPRRHRTIAVKRGHHSRRATPVDCGCAAGLKMTFGVLVAPKSFIAIFCRDNQTTLKCCLALISTQVLQSRSCPSQSSVTSGVNKCSRHPKHCKRGVKWVCILQFFFWYRLCVWLSCGVLCIYKCTDWFKRKTLCLPLLLFPSPLVESERLRDDIVTSLCK